MPTKRFLAIQKLYVTLGLNSLSKTEVTFLLKRLEVAERFLEKIDRVGYLEDADITSIKQYLKEGNTR